MYLAEIKFTLLNGYNYYMRALSHFNHAVLLSYIFAQLLLIHKFVTLILIYFSKTI